MLHMHSLHVYAKYEGNNAVPQSVYQYVSQSMFNNTAFELWLAPTWW